MDQPSRFPFYSRISAVNRWRCSIMTAEFEPQRRSSLKPIAVTIGDTRRLTGLGNTTVFQLIKRGTLKSKNVGRRRLVLYNSIEDLLQAD